MSQATTKETKKDEGISSYDAFEKAIMKAHAMAESDPHLIVSEELFQALANGRKTNYLTYGSPGVKVYRAGTKADIDAEENMGLVEFHEREIKRKRGEIK